MDRFVIVTDSYFDGAAHQADGPYCILVGDGVIEDIAKGGPALSREECPEACRQPGLKKVRAPFVMPGLVEAHCHLFLDGGELDFKRRKDYLAAPFEEMLSVARRNLAANLEAGVTLLRDAGDIHGVNTRMMEEVEADAGSVIDLLSAGTAFERRSVTGASWPGRPRARRVSCRSFGRSLPPPAS